MTATEGVLDRRPPRAPRARAGWLLPAGLIALGLLPLLANTVRRVALMSSPSADAPEMSLAVLVHIAGSGVFVVLGAFQFAPGLRRRRPAWHRIAGRVLIVAGLAAAGSGLWLTLTVTLAAGDGALLLVFRLLAALAMAASIVLGFAAILRRDVPRHRVWMMRAYALGLGAGTQVFTVGWGSLVFGDGPLAAALLNGAGWAVNLAVAEFAIRRSRPTRTHGELSRG
jgi:uncharacterized membrane protein